MLSEDLMVKAGRILKTFGRNGQLRCQIQDEFEGLFKKGNFIWLEVDGLKVPFLITQFVRQHKPLICFANIETEHQATLISGSWIYLKRSDFRTSEWPVIEAETLTYATVEGYRVYFSGNNKSGIITQVQQYPGQEMAFVKLDGNEENELLIPLVEEFIVTINDSHKSIEFAVPEGFFEL